MPKPTDHSFAYHTVFLVIWPWTTGFIDYASPFSPRRFVPIIWETPLSDSFILRSFLLSTAESIKECWHGKGVRLRGRKTWKRCSLLTFPPCSALMSWSGFLFRLWSTTVYLSKRCPGMNPQALLIIIVMRPEYTAIIQSHALDWDHCVHKQSHGVHLW